MTTKWEVNEAVQNSDLSPTDRHIMLTISDMASAKDGAVPEDRTPSQAELARRTGYTERTIRDRVRFLEGEGWLRLDRPSIVEMVRHKKIRYRLAIPKGRPASPTAGERKAKRAATVQAVADSAAFSEETSEQGNAEPRNWAKEATGTAFPDSEEPASALSLYDQTTTTPPPPAADAPAPEAAPTRLRRGREEDPQADNPAADAVLAQVDLGAEHVGRWTRHRMRQRVTKALGEGWTPQALVSEMTRDLGTARSRVSVVQARLGALGAPPRPTPTPPPFVAPTVAQIAPERVRSHAAAAREAIAAAKARWVPQPVM
jgi:hypothetical protein